MMRLTDQAHALISQVFQPGETAVDATAGNGHDTRFLCELAGKSGKVFAIDIQQQALDQTAVMLQELEYHNFELICGNHRLISELIPTQYQGRIGAVMFNLGYLPGGDHNLITQQSSTLTALKAAKEFLRPGGIMTILAYPGHPGGDEETVAIDQWLSQLSVIEYQTETIHAHSASAAAPCLFVLRKQEP
ncbi:MAG: 16S rRNA (cytosine(1402)-N(4))-methyltransferase [Gimesia sp.]|jgi:predicted methyltransferase|uniref:16S rRNA (Cytosine(1402)-N(4))-methyltransferase n=1 Tax=Gimesia maris TaxID=122 RepID=A0A3D3RBL7_9PLAN|nr:16S rRNA (cytosine(1402)-N(4))-methyltransferase [Gimesia sp.]HCO26254.1 16S rRNA (cytosine(1402)-N(4))-methyltransferase [Gimesia maris]|tara:strand:- start:42419 stop:42988 length:570 start_codon:yes stop_codon:yes gene_type:complete